MVVTRFLCLPWSWLGLVSSKVDESGPFRITELSISQKKLSYILRSLSLDRYKYLSLSFVFHLFWQFLFCSLTLTPSTINASQNLKKYKDDGRINKLGFVCLNNWKKGKQDQKWSIDAILDSWLALKQNLWPDTSLSFLPYVQDSAPATFYQPIRLLDLSSNPIRDEQPAHCRQ